MGATNLIFLRLWSVRVLNDDLKIYDMMVSSFMSVRVRMVITLQ